MSYSISERLHGTLYECLYERLYKLMMGGI